MTRLNSQTLEKSKTELKYPDRFNVVLVNDDVTPMEFVIHLLVEIFNKSINQAREIMITVHTEGRGIAGTYNYEIAEQKITEGILISRHHGHPLQIVMEKV
jgi:ATP-dependent Clp protease adaptor protein ClpS